MRDSKVRGEGAWMQGVLGTVVAVEKGGSPGDMPQQKKGEGAQGIDRMYLNTYIDKCTHM
eukprot:364500-Chlamydomonas_euryale.AAC.8